MSYLYTIVLCLVDLLMPMLNRAWWLDGL